METATPIEDLAQVATRWQDTMLSLGKEYKQEPEVLKIGGVPVGTLGNFSASIGKAKSKKTFNVSAMVAAALSGKEVLNYTTDFPEGKDRILYIDTEQSQNHCMIVMHRIMKLAELPANEDCGRFYFLALRKFNPKERLAIIDDAISQIEGLGLVVIDGIRDLVYDINSPSEATCVISKLMQWTDEHQIHLHTILHQNKSDENARGHIGTEMSVEFRKRRARKSTTRLRLSSKSKKTRTTTTSAKWKVCIPVPKTFCHLPFASMTNHFPNFCRTMCRQRRAQVVPSRNRSPLIKTSMKPSTARLSNLLLTEKRLFRDIRLWKKN